MGVLIGSAVIPIAYCLVWSKCTATAAITGAVSGICLAIMSWLIAAKTLEGELTLYSTGAHNPPPSACPDPNSNSKLSESRFVGCLGRSSAG